MSDCRAGDGAAGCRPAATFKRGDAPGNSFRFAIRQPSAIDPYRAQEVEGVGVTKLLFVGLVQVGTNQRLAPGVAHSWEANSAGTRWRFHLRQDVTFSNGEAVDALSFVRGVNRALDPQAATETAYHAAGISGFEALRSGDADRLGGLSALDRWTVLFKLDDGDFEFDKKTVQPIFSPVPAGAGGALNHKFNHCPVGNGPYVMAAPWEPGAGIELRRNTSWFGGPVAIEQVRLEVLDTNLRDDEEYLGLCQGRFDYARVPDHLVDQARHERGDQGGVEQYDLPGLHYLIPFCHRPPMDNLWTRRAISCAIDRDAIARDHFSSKRVPARSLVSPWFTGAHNPDVGGPYTRCNPDLARSCAAAGGLRGSVDLAYSTGGGHDGWVGAVAEQLETHLDINVRRLAMTPAELVAHRTSIAATGLCRAGWAYDYPTPDNLLYPLLHSACTSPDAKGTAHGDNEGRYCNPHFDAAVAAARDSIDEAARIRSWRAAEAIAMQDMALIPLWFRTEYRALARDRFEGVTVDFFGNPTLATARPVEKASRARAR